MILEERARGVAEEFAAIESRLTAAASSGDAGQLRDLSRQRSRLETVLAAAQAFQAATRELAGLREILADAGSDPDLKKMAEEDLARVTAEQAEAEAAFRRQLIPPDPRDDKSILVEIRAGTGGDEAGLFAGDLFRMYSHFAENKGLRVEVISSHRTEIGGFKEIIFSVEGTGAWSLFKFEGGVHRVQRVPATEASGRIHTSAATVAVLAEADEIDIKIDPNDLRIDVFRSQGPGGQSVNTTDSAVRVTHLPTGLVVSCQDEKSQLKNKAKALRVLRARLLEAEEEKRRSEMASTRKSMVGSGDRSERIRTYNFPQGRVTDHRIELTLYALDAILAGELERVVEPLRLADQEEKLKEMGAPGGAASA